MKIDSFGRIAIQDEALFGGRKSQADGVAVTDADIRHHIVFIKAIEARPARSNILGRVIDSKSKGRITREFKALDHGRQAHRVRHSDITDAQ